MPGTALIPILAALALAPSTARCAATIKIDHLGYRYDGPKLAIVSWPIKRSGEAPFARIDSTTPFRLKQGGRAVFTGRLSGPWKDKASGDVVWHADFSRYREADKGFTVEVTGLEPSDPFDIAGDPYERAVYLGMRGYYYQRCGMALVPRFAGRWTHGACHTADGWYYFNEEGRGHRPSNGGWHDAGDYGKKMMTAGPTVGILMSLCELFPEKIAELGLNLPETGNGVPDILNEVRWELEWMLTMQEANGAVHHELIPLEFQMTAPDAESPKCYFWRLSSFATADCAAAFAQASRVWRRWDRPFADKCLAAALRAWDFLARNPGVLPKNGIRQQPPSPPTLGYADDDDADERFWAAAELHRTTGEERFREYAREHLTDSLDLPGWRNVRAMGAAAFALDGTAGREPEATLREQLVDLADRELARTLGDPYRTGQNEYEWGSNSEVMCRAMVLIQAHEITRDERYRDAAEDLLHYVLGRNALDVCFLAGASAKSVRHIHNTWQWATRFEDPIPGLVSGGPNRFFQDDVIRRTIPRDTPPAKCFVDAWGCYSANENDIHYSAPFVFTAGWFHFTHR